MPQLHSKSENQLEEVKGFRTWIGARASRLVSHRLTPFLAIAVLVVIYSLGFARLNQSFGIVGRAFCLTYILIAAGYWGAKGGAATALLTIPLNIALSKNAGLVVLPAGFPGPAIVVAGGVLIGYLKDLNLRLRKELRERNHADKELKRYQEQLEALVKERTKDLTSINNALEQEIIERKKFEGALRESEERFHDLADSLPQTIFEVDANGTITFANRNAFETFDYTQEDLARGPNAASMIVAEDRNKLVENMTRIIHGEVVSGHEYRAQRKDGSTFPVIIYSSPMIREGRPVGLRGILVDITEYKRLESSFHQAQKMESVGRLAGGVAHDFNNILTIIIGHAELGLMRLGSDDRLRHDFQEILGAAERASKLTRQLLAFSRRQLVEPRVLSLNEILLEMDKMLRRLIGEDVELVTLPGEGLGSVKVDPGQVEQVIANLAVNARDAMPKGGKLILQTSNLGLKQELEAPGFVVEPGEYVMLTVTDTGVGMTNAVKDNIFEPFFTTKKEGTGLGLATCYGIVKQNRGYIWAESESGQGTTFTIYLPRVHEAARADLEVKGGDRFRRGKETILLVEDELSVREIAAHVLRERGYEVLEASNGEEALRVAAGLDGRKIHLLLTDIVMPELGGVELAERLSAERHGLKVLFLSGYPGEAIVRGSAPAPGRTILKKPFSPARLAQKVRETLDGSSEV